MPVKLKIALLGLTAFVVFIIMYAPSDTELMTSTVDGRTYRVLKRDDSSQAADMLARINATLSKLTHHMLASAPTDADARRLYDRFSPEVVEEGAFDSDHTSFSVNKGEKIVFCLRHKDGKLVDLNTVLYVAIHELAHVMTSTIGHDRLFWRNMRKLVEEARGLNLYTYVDYSESPARYCGIHIKNSV